MINLTLNGNSLQSSNIIVSEFNHESIVYDMNEVKIPHRPGKKLTAWTPGVKKITIKGEIIGADAQTVTQYVNLINSYRGQQNIPLYFDSYVGANLDRFYMVNVVSVDYVRTASSIFNVPFTLNLEAIDPPFSFATSPSNAYLANYQNGNLDFDATFTGTANPQPTILIRSHVAATSITLTNNTTGTSLTINDTISPADEYIIDCQAWTITKNGVDFTLYDGVFPDFYPGDNSLNVSTDSTDWDITIDYYEMNL
jgi:phage-related protein